MDTPRYIVTPVKLSVRLPILFDALIKEFVEGMNIQILASIANDLIRSGLYRDATHIGELMCRKIHLFYSTSNANSKNVIEHSATPTDVTPVIQMFIDYGLLQSAQAILASSRELGSSVEIEEINQNLAQCVNKYSFFFEERKSMCRLYGKTVLHLKDQDLDNFVSNECHI